MTRQELGRAIAKPARKQRVVFETGLVARILDDVGDEPGNLPLLKFALPALWERMVGGRLTHEAYEAIGRVAGALALTQMEHRLDLALLFDTVWPIILGPFAVEW